MRDLFSRGLSLGFKVLQKFSEKVKDITDDEQKMQEGQGASTEADKPVVKEPVIPDTPEQAAIKSLCFDDLELSFAMGLLKQGSSVDEIKEQLNVYRLAPVLKQFCENFNMGDSYNSALEIFKQNPAFTLVELQEIVKALANGDDVQKIIEVFKANNELNNNDTSENGSTQDNQGENISSGETNDESVKSEYDKDGYNVLGYDREGYNRKGYNAEGFNRQGYDIYGYDKNGYDKDGFDKKGFNVHGYDKEGYDRTGFNANGFNREGYDKNGYDKNGYDVDGYNKEGYSAQGFDRAGYDKNGYDKNGFDKSGFNAQGYDKEGYDKKGFNAEGIDRQGYNTQGYDKDGFNRNGINAEGYDRNGNLVEGYGRDGFDKNGFDKEGYDREGYDKNGYNREGFNRAGYDVNGFNKEGYNAEGYNQDGFNKEGYNSFGFNIHGYDRDGFDRDGYNAQGYDRQGYDKNGYNKDGYNYDGFNQDGYNAQGYNKDGYNVDGFNIEGYNKQGYDKEGYNKEGFNSEGYNKEGFNKEGYNKEGYDKDGFNKSGFNKDGVNREGFNSEGYNANGFDKEGYNKEGYDKDGFNKEGYNKEGYDKDGFNKEGYNKDGFNREGYNAQGYDKDGYTKEGYNKEGYDRNGYDKEGFDKDGFDKEGYNLIGLDKDGYDREGYNTQGYDKDGYNAQGYDVQGFDRNGLNAKGYDKNGVKVEETIDSKGNRTTKYYENDKLTKSVHYDAATKACTTTFYDSQGNKLPSAKDSLPDSVAIQKKVLWKTISRNHKQLYDGITTGYDKAFISKYGVSFTARQCVEVGWGEHTADFLGYAQVGYNKTPEGSQKLSSYEKSQYGDFIKDKLEATLSDAYGYKPEDVKGYNFKSSSSISQDMSSDEAVKKFIKSNIQQLLAAGYSTENPSSVTFDTKDLKNSIHNAYVIDSNITGTTLSLSLFDIYDFNVNSTDALGKTASAAMLDGKLVPYYATFDLKIDLKNIFSEQELKKLGIDSNTQSGVKEPEPTTPSTPQNTTQTVLENTTPTVPENTTPTVPENTTPTVPENTTPTVPENTTPTVSESTTPTVPENTTPTVPESTTPTVPENTTPTVPENTTPTIPESTTPTVPENTTPTVPEVQLPPQRTYETVDSKGNITTDYYENGQIHKTVYYDAATQACKTTYYDENGKPLPDKRSTLPNNDTAISKKVNWPWPISKFKGPSVYTKSSQELYDGLTTKYDDRSFFSAVGGAVNLTARECVEVGWGKLTADFLGYAQVGYNGTPEGAQKISSYKNTEQADFIEKSLLNTVNKDYGYQPEHVKGYSFNSNSSISQAMAQDETTKKFVKDNIKAILAGSYSTENTGAMTFKNNEESKDLYNSIASITVIGSKVSGTNLTLNLFDIYDFDVNAKDTLNKTASAAMSDGKLIPYYAMFDVNINLKDIFTDAELKELGITV